jgi:serine/threonine protein kinase
MSMTPGTRFGAYEVAALIGVGGMGEVYRAHDPSLKRDVALKVLPEDLSRRPAASRPSPYRVRPYRCRLEAARHIRVLDRTYYA